MISGSEINNAKDIKHLFLAARAKESCIIFIDEFDVMGKENKNNELSKSKAISKSTV